MERIVGMGEYVVTDREEDVIRTFALASCVAVTVYSPRRKTAGMIHVVLPAPLSHTDERERPGYFAGNTAAGRRSCAFRSMAARTPE